MERYLLKISRISLSIPYMSMMHKIRLTGDKDRHINEGSIPGYDEEYLGYTPFSSPNMLDFTIEARQPVVCLVSGDCPKQKNCE